MLICFAGVDGSGKSLQAQRLIEHLNAAGHPAVYVWSGGRSTITRPLIRLGKRLFKAPARPHTLQPATPATGQQYQAYLASMQRLFKRRFLRALWIQVSLAEHTAEICASVLPQLLRGRIVVCDRYIYDTIIGIAVLSGVGSTDLPNYLRLSPLYRVPTPDKWFFIDLPAAVAFARKDDIVDIEFLERRVPLYRTAAATLGMQTLDGTASPDEITAVVWQSVQPLLRKTPTPALH